MGGASYDALVDSFELQLGKSNALIPKLSDRTFSVLCRYLQQGPLLVRRTLSYIQTHNVDSYPCSGTLDGLPSLSIICDHFLTTIYSIYTASNNVVAVSVVTFLTRAREMA